MRTSSYAAGIALVLSTSSRLIAAPSFQILPIPLPEHSTASAINDAGDVLFRQQVPAAPGVLIDLPGLFADGHSSRFGRAVVTADEIAIAGLIPSTKLNNRGQAVGYDDAGDFVRDRDGR